MNARKTKEKPSLVQIAFLSQDLKENQVRNKVKMKTLIAELTSGLGTSRAKYI